MQPYKKLFTFWYAVVIYDLTVEFCDRWIKSWKLREQMTGAARSGKQNIVEASDNLRTSLKMAIKITGTSKGSLEELIGDLEDFLRQRGLAARDKAHPQVRRWRAQSVRLVRDLSSASKEADVSNLSYLRLLRQELPLPEAPEEAANLLLTLCHQATYLLDQQVKSLEKKHETEGGYSENLYRKRKERRGY